MGDINHPERGILPDKKVNVGAPSGSLVQDMLADADWGTDEPWAPLCRNLTEPVEKPGVRVKVIGPEQAHVWAARLRVSFEGSRFTEEPWHAMAGGTPYADARCLVGYDNQGDAVACVTVWSVGQGKPGLLEPMGVDQNHRGRGYGKAITVASVTALQDMGASSAIVYTPSSNIGAVATYLSAGFQPLPEVRDGH